MSYRPNFSKVTHKADGTLFIEGTSERARDQMTINVALQQGPRVSHAAVTTVGMEWSASIPVKDDDPHEPGPDFDPAQPVLAFGTETRSRPFVSFSWVDVLMISPIYPAPPGP